ncbi:MAG: VanW family protein [Clostridia bacterium]|nr:VanW family protein [Clostridia bacterium]
MEDMNKNDDQLSLSDVLESGEQPTESRGESAPDAEPEFSDTRQIKLTADEITIPTAELDRMAEPSEFASPESGRDVKRRAIVITAVALFLILLLGFAIVAVYNVYFYTKVYKGVFVSDLDFSGATKREVLAALNDKYEGKIPGETLKITIGDNEYDFDISKNVSYDLRTTADNVVFYGRQGSFVKRLHDINEARRFGSEVPVSYMTNDEGLETQIQIIATRIKRDISQSGWRLENNKLLLDRGQSGQNLDIKELLTFIKNKLYNGDLSPAVFELQQDETDELDLTAIKAAIETEPRGPSLDLDSDPSGKTIIPGIPGIYLDLEKANAILAATPDTQRIVEIPLELTMPDMSDDTYRSLLFEDKLATCTTPFTNNADRTNNVILASEAVNGVIIMPGETFSYNATVGERTRERGYKEAIIYVGTSAEAGLGGGVCQISSALYYCSLRADLEIVERYAHSRMVTYVPLGEDATVAWPNKDYKFKNTGDYPIRIVAYHTKSDVTIEFWGTNTTPTKEVVIETKTLSRTPFQTVYQDDPTLPVGSEKVKSNGYTGYVTESYRVIKMDGEEVSRNFENKSVYGKYDKIVLRNKATTVTTPTTPAEPTPTEPAPTEPTPTEPTPAEPTPTEPTPTEPTPAPEDPASPTNLF